MPHSTLSFSGWTYKTTPSKSRVHFHWLLWTFEAMMSPFVNASISTNLWMHWHLYLSNYYGWSSTLLSNYQDVSFTQSEWGTECEIGGSGEDQYLELDLLSGDDIYTRWSRVSQASTCRTSTSRVNYWVITERQRHFLDYYKWRVYLSWAEATTIEEVLSTPDKAHWLDAMEKEVKSLQEKDVWELVELPKSQKPVSSK